MNRNMNNKKLLNYTINLIGFKHLTLCAISYTFLSILEVTCLYFIGLTLTNFFKVDQGYSSQFILSDYPASARIIILLCFLFIVGISRILVSWYNFKLSAITASRINDKVLNKITKGLIYGFLKLKTSEAISILIDQIDRINACFIQT